MKVNSSVLAVVTAALLVVTLVPEANLAAVNALATLTLLFQSELPSISIDLSMIFSYAASIVNMMMPIVGVGAGISFGFALVAYIIRLFRNIF
jgi:hypothetical protein